MKTALPLAAALAILLVISPTYADTEQGHYGAELTLNDPVSVEYAITHFEQLKDKDILIEGITTNACQKKGCWITLKGKDDEIRVTFKDYGFFVPPSLVDKKVQAQGRLYKRTLRVSEAQHYAQDAGKSGQEINSIKQPIEEYRFVAIAVKEQP